MHLITLSFKKNKDTIEVIRIDKTQFKTTKVVISTQGFITTHDIYDEMSMNNPYGILYEYEEDDSFLTTMERIYEEYETTDMGKLKMMTDNLEIVDHDSYMDLEYFDEDLCYISKEVKTDCIRLYSPVNFRRRTMINIIKKYPRIPLCHLYYRRNMISGLLELGYKVTNDIIDEDERWIPDNVMVDLDTNYKSQLEYTSLHYRMKAELDELGVKNRELHKSMMNKIKLIEDKERIRVNSERYAANPDPAFEKIDVELRRREEIRLKAIHGANWKKYSQWKD